MWVQVPVVVTFPSFSSTSDFDSSKQADAIADLAVSLGVPAGTITIATPTLANGVVEVEFMVRSSASFATRGRRKPLMFGGACE